MNGKWYLVLKLESKSILSTHNFYYALGDGRKLVYLPLLGVEGESEAVAKAEEIWLKHINIEPKISTITRSIVYEIPLF
jgi:hypothetical protein